MAKQEGLSFTVGGMALAGMYYIGNMFLNYMPDGKALALAGGVTVGSIFLDKFFGESKYDSLFLACGLKNINEQVPIVIKKERKDKTTTYVIHMPAGISQHHFEAKREELEQYFNATIDFSFNKNLIMKVTNNILKLEYPYIFEVCDRPLKVYCGETNQGKFYIDIEKCPHILAAGETGSGKTSLLDNIVLSLILNSFNIDIHLIDFQAVGLGIFESCRKIKSYGETPADFEKLLGELAEENEKRLRLFRSVKNKIYIENLRTWNEHYPERALPYKVIVVDEFARLAEKEYEGILEKFRTRISMDRKVGIHYVVAMQRPDVKCIEGSIKANMPTRIAFKTVSGVDSKVIIDQEGAEEIKNPGRFLVKYCGEITEAQALYIESNKVRSWLKKYHAYKTSEELVREKQQQEDEAQRKLQQLQAEAEARRKQQIEDFHKSNNNPYKKGGKNDNKA